MIYLIDNNKNLYGHSNNKCRECKLPITELLSFSYNHLLVMICNDETLISINNVRNLQWIDKFAVVNHGIWD